MDKKTKKHIEVLQTRLQKLRQQLAGAKKQCDDPEELANLQKEIADTESQIQELIRGLRI